MTLDEIMAANEGVWDNDVAVVKHGAYHVRLASRLDGNVTLLEEGLRSFPDMVLGAQPTNAPAKKKLTK